MRSPLLLVCTLLLCACGHSSEEHADKRKPKGPEPTVIVSPHTCFNRWAGYDAPADIKVLHGRYWESAHWTREYIVHLDMEWPKEYVANYISDNHLTPIDSMPPLGADTPEWFAPSPSMRSWSTGAGGNFTVFLEDTLTRRVLLFERQL